MPTADRDFLQLRATQGDLMAASREHG